MPRVTVHAPGSTAVLLGRSAGVGHAYSAVAHFILSALVFAAAAVLRVVVPVRAGVPAFFGWPITYAETTLARPQAADVATRAAVMLGGEAHALPVADAVRCLAAAGAVRAYLPGSARRSALPAVVHVTVRFGAARSALRPSRRADAGAVGAEPAGGTLRTARRVCTGIRGRSAPLRVVTPATRRRARRPHAKCRPNRALPSHRALSSPPSRGGRHLRTSGATAI
jgi:hypothetical protein